MVAYEIILVQPRCNNNLLPIKKIRILVVVRMFNSDEDVPNI